MHFNVLDGLVPVTVALAVVAGLKVGFKPWATELVSFAFGLGVAFALFEPVAGFLHRLTGVALGVTGFGAFLMLLAIGHAAIQRPASALGARIGERWIPRLAPRAARVVTPLPAVGTAVVVVSVVLSALVVLPAETPRALVAGSTLGTRITDQTRFMQRPLRSLILPASQGAGNLLDPATPADDPGEDAFLKLNFPATLSTEGDAAGEDRMLGLLNRARSEAGLSPLRADESLTGVARQHSLDMYRRHYFSHTTPTPEAKSPYDRLRDAHVRFVTAGENIAFAPDVEAAWVLLMKSPDHRANILNPDFRCVGIGAVKGLGGYEEMVTQDFSDCSP